jgi:3-oxoadipate enol-lactonase
MPFASLRGIRLYYELGGNAGSGRRLLFINGSGGDLRQIPSPAEGPLGRDFQVLAYDQRGLGQSDKPERDYSMADYAADAIALLDHVGWERCRVYGVSFGGMVAQELAVTAPERIEKLCLACTSPGGAGGSSYPLHEIVDLSPDEAGDVHLKLLDTRGAGAGPVLQAIARAMASRRNLVGDDPSRAAGYRRQLAARKDHDTFERLGWLDMPVLIAAGRYDGIAPPANQEAMHAAIPGSRLEWFDGGHVFMFQDPRAGDVIHEFLR